MRMVEPTEGEGRVRRPVALVVLVLASTIYGSSLPFAVVASLMSPVAFHGGQSPVAWAYLGGALSYPILVVTTLVAGWLLYRRQRYRAALVVLLVPLLG